ncbi:MAG TPA: hypothetical protein VLM42_08135, partial [Bryobacteraceae bacterium]|nr:hypothetical protein [Bryobacteraceae bacterium]
RRLDVNVAASLWGSSAMTKISIRRLPRDTLSEIKGCALLPSIGASHQVGLETRVIARAPYFLNGGRLVLLIAPAVGGPISRAREAGPFAARWQASLRMLESKNH